MTRFLYKYVFIIFAVFLAAAVMAFWPGYFTQIGGQVESLLHHHGIPMTLWCIMLVSQALLIRYKKYKIHRFMGMVSYALVPLIIYSTIKLIDNRMGGPGPITPLRAYSMTLMYNATFAFGIIYGLAMINRKRVDVHARYMVATIFPLFSPVTDRLIYNHFPALIEYAPLIEGYPIAPFLGFVLGDLILITLAIIDLIRKPRQYTFVWALGILLIYHISVMTFYQFEWWRNLLNGLA